MDNIKPLIALPSPRNIDIVIERHDNELKHIPHLWVKFWQEQDAYQIIRNYFLSHEEYTHLIISPDDLVVKLEHYEALVKTLEKSSKKYPVLSGVCNKSMYQADQLNICIDTLPNIDRRQGRKWICPTYETVEKGIIKVMFSGFPFMFIRRDVVEKIDFESDARWNPYQLRKRYVGFDLPFCQNCHDNNVPIYVDTRVKLLHLLGASQNEPYARQVENKLVGKERPQVYFKLDGQTTDLTDQYKTLVSITH